MAQKVLVEMIDDLDGAQASKTVPFGLDGTHYEIDPSDDNAAALRATNSRRSSVPPAAPAAARPPAPPRPHRPPRNRERSKAIRTWAVENSWAISERGRIPAHVVAAYEESLKQDEKPRRKRTTEKPLRSSASAVPGGGRRGHLSGALSEVVSPPSERVVSP